MPAVHDALAGAEVSAGHVDALAHLSTGLDWTLTLHPDRTIALHRPDGTLYSQGTTTNRATPSAGPTEPDAELPRPRRPTAAKSPVA
jgi:hypothetical protein